MLLLVICLVSVFAQISGAFSNPFHFEEQSTRGDHPLGQSNQIKKEPRNVVIAPHPPGPASSVLAMKEII